MSPRIVARFTVLASIITRKPLATKKEHIMTQANIIGLIALAGGCVLLFFAWQSSNSPVDQMSEALTGRFTGNTMWYLMAGLIGVVAGGALLYRGFSRG